MKTNIHCFLCAALCGLTLVAHAEDREARPERDDNHNQGGGVVKSLNGLDGRVSLHAGSNITIVPAGNGLRISVTSVVAGPDATAWHRGGDMAAPGDFLGTWNNQPLEFKVNGQRALRLEPNAEGAPNVIGGAPVNYVAQGTVGAVLGGGGALDFTNGFNGTAFGAISNSVSADFGVVVGGSQNDIGGKGSIWSFIGGGHNNRIQESAWSFIGAGMDNAIRGSGGSTICGGESNTIFTNGDYSTISGGSYNAVGPSSFGSSIGGGEYNWTGRPYSVVAGGSQNSAASAYTAIGGGWQNSIQTNCTFSTIGGGAENLVSGRFAIVAGGDQNLASTRSFAAGTRAKANHTGSFVWGDSTDADVPSFADNSFVARASGGVLFYSSPDLTSGAYLAPGGGSWSMLSDRNTKENIQPVDVRAVLDKLRALPLATWNYKSQDKSIRHLGPTAQDFHTAFQVGEDERHITAVDADGVALAAIQGLNQKLEDQHAENAQLRERLKRLEFLVEKLSPQTFGGKQ